MASRPSSSQTSHGAVTLRGGAGALTLSLDCKCVLNAAASHALGTLGLPVWLADATPEPIHSPLVTFSSRAT